MSRGEKIIPTHSFSRSHGSCFSWAVSSQPSAVSASNALGAEFSPVVDSRPMNPSERELSYSSETRSNADDVALIRRMCDADETALGALYDRWVRSLYSLILQMLKDPDEAEDVVEETFWQAWRKASSYEPSKGAVSTWLLTIGRRKAHDRIRERRRYKEEPIGRDQTFANLPAPGLDPSEQTEGQELKAHVRAALQELPSEQREV